MARWYVLETVNSQYGRPPWSGRIVEADRPSDAVDVFKEAHEIWGKTGYFYVVGPLSQAAAAWFVDRTDNHNPDDRTEVLVDRGSSYPRWDGKWGDVKMRKVA